MRSDLQYRRYLYIAQYDIRITIRVDEELFNQLNVEFATNSELQSFSDLCRKKLQINYIGGNNDERKSN